MNLSARTRKLVLGLGAVLMFVLADAPGYAAKQLDVPVGTSKVIQGVGIRQVAVSNPSVLDVQPISTRELLITGIAPGTTPLFFWDRLGRHDFDVKVNAAIAAASPFVGAVKSAIANEAVKVEAVGDKILLRGQVASRDELRRCESVAKALYPSIESLLTVRPGATAQTLESVKSVLSPMNVSASLVADGKILIRGEVENSASITSIKQALQPWANDADFVFDLRTAKPPREEAIESLSKPLAKWDIKPAVLPDGRILVEGTVPDEKAAADVDKLISQWPKELGIVSRIAIAGSTTARQVLISSKVVEMDVSDAKELGVDWSRIMFEESASGSVTYTAEDQPFVIGQPRPGPYPLFGGPPISQLDPIGARISALVQSDRAHILAQPSLVASSGSPATILIGGEIPVPVPQAGAAAAAVVTIEYKQFGISLEVTPTVGEECEIALKIKPEVSTLDYGNAIVLSGFVVPAFRTRRAETTVHVRSGTSIAIGGLLSHEEIKNLKGLPLLKDIPVLGNFFKKSSSEKKKTELLIVVTPRLVGVPAENDFFEFHGPNPPSLKPYVD